MVSKLIEWLVFTIHMEKFIKYKDFPIIYYPAYLKGNNTMADKFA